MNVKIIKLSAYVFTIIIALSAASFAQQIKWLRVTELQSPINDIGAEFEGEFAQGNTNFFSWPGQYSINQNTTRMKGLWIGCKNFEDPLTHENIPTKVIASGPRNAADRVLQIFPQELKLTGRFEHPTVIVDNNYATSNDTYDLLDEVDPDMPADRMVELKFNTSLGISVTKKVMAFDHPDHDNYFINEYTFKNTGIYDAAGNVFQQDLEEVYFYFIYRYAFAGVTSDGFGSTWGAFASTWGNSTINHAFGNNTASADFTDPNSLLYQLRGFYSYYGPSADRLVTYEDDWGCPNENEDGLLGAAKYTGCVTLHADRNPANNEDDIDQPATTWFISSDINSVLGVISDAAVMADRYTIMSEGHPDQPHSAYVAGDYPINYSDARRNSGGGTSQGQGYGAYNLNFGDSIKIVFAEGVSGLSWETCRIIGNNWIQYYNSSSSPTLVKPDQTTTANHNEYKRLWAETGVDSILKTFNNARYNFDQQYDIQKPPPPPMEFTVESGGNAINLHWADNAANSENFDGYVIYRSEGNVLGYETVYEKIFQCSGHPDSVVHDYADAGAKRGSDYYYYIQSKSDGSGNELQPGEPLYSSLFWTITNLPANLQRPPADDLYEVRVVPNPYDIRARALQFGDDSQIDRIAFYGLPDRCKVTVLTERGDIVWQKNHTNGTGDELWDSKTSSGQIVVSGIYILHIQVTEDIYALDDRIAQFDVYDDKLKLKFTEGQVLHRAGDLVYRKGQSTFRKFVIIR